MYLSKGPSINHVASFSIKTSNPKPQKPSNLQPLNPQTLKPLNTKTLHWLHQSDNPNALPDVTDHNLTVLHFLTAR